MIRGRAAHARKAKGDVRRACDRAGLLAVLGGRRVAQREPRLIEGIEVLEDQEGERLAEIKRRLADRAEQVALGIVLGRPRADARKILSGHHDRWLQRAGQARKVEADVDMGRIGRADEHRVRCLRRPTRHVGGAEIRCIKLRSGDLGDAVDAAGPGRGRVPSPTPRQRFPLVKARLVGEREGRNGERDAARRCELHEFASRHAHAPRFLCRRWIDSGFLSSRGRSRTNQKAWNEATSPNGKQFPSRFA